MRINGYHVIYESVVFHFVYLMVYYEHDRITKAKRRAMPESNINPTRLVV